jgi:hypothetical protein
VISRETVVIKMKKLHDDVAISSAEQKNNIIAEQKAFLYTVDRHSEIR